MQYTVCQCTVCHSCQDAHVSGRLEGTSQHPTCARLQSPGNHSKLTTDVRLARAICGLASNAPRTELSGIPWNFLLVLSGGVLSPSPLLPHAHNTRHTPCDTPRDSRCVPNVACTPANIRFIRRLAHLQTYASYGGCKCMTFAHSPHRVKYQQTKGRGRAREERDERWCRSRRKRRQTQSSKAAREEDGRAG